MTLPPSLRILHLQFGKDGGAERFFVSLVQALGERQVEQRFIIRPKSKWRKDIETLGDITENYGRPLSLSGLMLHRKMHRLLRIWQPHVIMAWALRGARFLPNYPEAIKVTRLGDYPANLKLLGRSDILVSNTPGITQHCIDIGWTGRTQTITNFPRPVTPSPIDRATLQTPQDAFVIASAGRLAQHKAFDFLIRLMARLPDAYLWVIGDGAERKNLHALAAKLNVAERIRFTGWVEDPIHYMAAANVFAMPSRHEPLGNNIIEAWQAGTPVISTRSQGPSWFMSNGVNGSLTAIDDMDEFIAAIQQIRTDPAYAAALIDGGKEQLNAVFNKAAITSQYTDLFNSRLG